ncbi:unnamed protein product [Cunninghamella echinulata]
MAALETSSNITDLMSFQQLVDCTEVIDLFTGTSMDYELRPRPGKIILQDKFVLLTDNNNGQPLRVYMILTSDMLMICHQKNESTGRYQLLYPPLAVNDIYIQPIMLDRELIGEYTLEITILDKKLTVRAESKEIRNIWSGMPSTTTAKNAIKVSIPLIHVVNPSLKSTSNNKNNNSTPSPVVVKSDLPPSSFYQNNNNNNDMSPVDSDEDDEDDDEDSDATYPSSNNLNISSTATAPQPPKKDNTMKSLPMPVINISLHDDEKIIQGDQKQNQPLKPRVSSIRAPLPNPDLKSSKVSPSSTNNNNNNNQQIESKPLPRTSSIRQNNKNSSQQSSTSTMMQRQPSNPNQPPSTHHQHRPLPSPSGNNNNNNNNRVSSVPRPPMQYPQQHSNNNNTSNQHYHQRPPINQYTQPRPPQHYQQRPPMHHPQQQQQQQQRPLSNHSSLQQRSSMHHPQQQRPPAHHSQQQRPHSNQTRPPMHYPQQQSRPPLHHSNQSQPRPPTHYLQQQQQQQPRPHSSQQQRHHSQTTGLLTNANVSKPLPNTNTTTQPRPQSSKSHDLNNATTATSSSHRPMPPTPPPQQNQFNAKQSSSSSQSSTNDSSSTIGEMDMQQSPLPPTPNSSDSSSGSSLLRLSPEDLASPPRSPNPYNNNQINGIRQVLFRNDQSQVFRWKDETWYAVEGQCLLEVRQTFSNRSCIAIRVQKSGELYLNAWILPQTQIRMASATDISLGVVMGPRHETYLIHFEKTTEATEFNQILQQMHHTAILQAQQQSSSSNGTLRHSPPTELRDNYDDEDENDDENIVAGMNGVTFNNNNNGNGSSSVRRTLVRSTSLMQSGQEPTPIPQTLEKVMQCKCKLFSQNEHSNWSSFGSVQLIVSLQIPSQRMHIQILHDKKRGFSKIIPSGTNITSSSAPSSPSLSTTNPNQLGTNSSSLSSSSASLAAPSSSPTETTLVSATVYSNNVERLNAKRITFLLVNERERTESMVYMVQVREEDAGNALYDYLKIKNAQNGW